MDRTTFAVFKTPSEAATAIATLQSKGVDAGDITVSASDSAVQEYLSHLGEEASPVPGASQGAAAGGMAGAALSVIPMVLAGVVAAPVFILSAIGGAMGGALAGGILGTGYQLQQAEAVERSLADGNVLVAVKTGDGKTDEVASILTGSGGFQPGPVLVHETADFNLERKDG